MALVSVAEAREHLRIAPSSEGVSDLLLKLGQATALVVHYLKRTDIDPDTDALELDLTDATAVERAIIQTAILEVLSNIDRFRGDDEKGENPADEMFMTPKVRGLLSMLRDPALA